MGFRRCTPASFESGQPTADCQAEAHSTDQGSEEKGKENGPDQGWGLGVRMSRPVQPSGDAEPPGDATKRAGGVPAPSVGSVPT